MSTEFSDLKELAQQKLDFPPIDLLATQAVHYQDAPVEEIFELLEEIVESYRTLANVLPSPLQVSAKEEIEFFATLAQERLTYMLYKLTPHQSLKLVQYLPSCV